MVAGQREESGALGGLNLRKKKQSSSQLRWPELKHLARYRLSSWHRRSCRILAAKSGLSFISHKKSVVKADLLIQEAVLVLGEPETSPSSGSSHLTQVSHGKGNLLPTALCFPALMEESKACKQGDKTRTPSEGTGGRGGLWSRTALLQASQHTARSRRVQAPCQGLWCPERLPLAGLSRGTAGDQAPGSPSDKALGQTPLSTS